MMKPMEELVSVIVPVYNIEEYLPRCLECINAQTYANLEIILVDDGSTDGTGRLCDEYAASDSRARVIHHPENRGLWAARNTGQDAATGEYLWFPDGDDYFHKDIIKVMHEAINLTNASGDKYDLAFVGFKRTKRFDEDVLSEINPPYVEKSLEEVLEVFVRPTENFTGRNVWNKLCRKELIEDLRTGNYNYSQDCDFSLKMYLKSPRIVCVGQPLYFFVDRPSSARFSSDFVLISNYCVVKILYGVLLSQKEIPNSCRRYILEDLYIRMAILLDEMHGVGGLTAERKVCRRIVLSTGYAYLLQSQVKTPMRRLRRIGRLLYFSSVQK